MGKCLAVCALFLLMLVSGALAMDECSAGHCANCHSLTLKEANELLSGVGAVKKVTTSPVNGLWLLELERDGRQGVVFMDFGKKNLIAGTVLPLASKNEARKPAAGTATPARVDVASIPLGNSIVMGNPNGKKKLFVFTDPDCPFCSKLHGELKRLAAMEPDLAVYVKMYPLQMHPAAYDKARVILGGGSPELLDKAFAGGALPAPGAADSGTPVDETIRVARSLGINSTPTLVFPDGTLVIGARDAAALKGMLAADKK